MVWVELTTWLRLGILIIIVTTITAWLRLSNGLDHSKETPVGREWGYKWPLRVLLILVCLI